MPLNVLTAAVAIGISRRCYEETLAYARTRQKDDAMSTRILTWLAAWQDEQMSGFNTIWNTVNVLHCGSLH